MRLYSAVNHKWIRGAGVCRYRGIKSSFEIVCFSGLPGVPPNFWRLNEISKCAQHGPKKRLTKRLGQKRCSYQKRRFITVRKFLYSLRSQYCRNSGVCPAADDHDRNSQTKILNMPLILAPYKIWASRLSRWCPQTKILNTWRHNNWVLSSADQSTLKCV